MKRKKRKAKKKFKVIIIFIFIILLIGGISIYMLLNNKDKKTNTEKTKDVIATDKNDETTTTEEETTKTLPDAPQNNTEFKALSDGDYKTEKGYTLTIKNGIAYIDGNLIVNKTYSLPDTFAPTNPYSTITGDYCTNCINTEVMQAFKTMQSDATSIGLNIYISSGYRSYNKQTSLYNNYVAADGQLAADKYSARPGYSEHQTGLCFDLNSITDAFANTQEGIWVNNNAYQYGFIIRFPKGKETETGYQYESWHLRYIGKDLAEKLYNNGSWLTLEDYYGITSSYQ